MKLSFVHAACLGIVFAVCANAQAEEQVEQHAAHEHGMATLSIAVGEEGLEIMLDSPAANLFGFEHSASTAEEHQKLSDIKAKLEAADELFGINPETECTLKDAEVVSSLLGNTDQEEGSEHNDVEAIWSYACAKPAEFKEIAVKLFTAFPNGFQKIKAEWVTDKGASAQELDKDDVLKID